MPSSVIRYARERFKVALEAVTRTVDSAKLGKLIGCICSFPQNYLTFHCSQSSLSDGTLFLIIPAYFGFNSMQLSEKAKHLMEQDGVTGNSSSG